MQTTTTLLYQDAPVDQLGLDSVIGPFHFSSEEEAIDQLATYVKRRIHDTCSDLFVDHLIEEGIVTGEQIDAHDLTEFDGFLAFIKAHIEKLSNEYLVNFYQSVQGADDDMKFDYEINTHSVVSCKESVMAADVLNIDGYGYCSIAKPNTDDDPGSNEYSPLIEVWDSATYSGDSDFTFTLADFNDAIFLEDEEGEYYWKINSHKVVPLHLNKQETQLPKS
ncbi:hypothetical protein [Vibrio sp. 10N.239.312.D08]|uniref:hypothetical protein n=1 Tax=Vibrio sp. 10N.239.312.D08 TaxID=3229978 RepID=UPI00354FEF4E